MDLVIEHVVHHYESGERRNLRAAPGIRHIRLFCNDELLFVVMRGLTALKAPGLTNVLTRETFLQLMLVQSMTMSLGQYLHFGLCPQ